MLMRISAALFAAAAFFGVLRFTGIHAQTFPHQWLSMLTGAAAFPALAYAVARPASRAAREALPAIALVAAAGAVGIAVVLGLGWRPYVDACAVLSVVVMFSSMRQRSDRIGGAGALAMFVGLMCFAAKFPTGGPLVPGDLLHLGIAAGWTLLARRRG